MKKNSATKSPRRKQESRPPNGSRSGWIWETSSRYCVLNEAGEVILERSVATTKKGICRRLAPSNDAGCALRWARIRPG